MENNALNCRYCGAPYPDHAAGCSIKLRRRIVDYLNKYVTDTQLRQVARFLGIKTD